MKKNLILVLTTIVFFSGHALSEPATHSIEYEVSKNETSRVGFWYTQKQNTWAFVGEKHNIEILKQPQNGKLEVKWEVIQLKNIKLKTEGRVTTTIQDDPDEGKKILSSVYYYTPDKDFEGFDRFTIRWSTKDGKSGRVVTRIIEVK